jgi:hypothetical protein
MAKRYGAEITIPDWRESLVCSASEAATSTWVVSVTEHGCDWTRALREISNRDKHREFVAMRGVAAGLAYVSTDPEYGSLALPVLRVPHPAHGCEVDVKVDLPYTVHFADGPPVMDTLEVIKTKVFETLTEFRAEFK